MKIRAFSYIELVVVIILVAILGIFAYPNYIDYIISSRIAALWRAAEAAKLHVESQYLRYGTAMSSIDVNSGSAEYTTPKNDYIKCITVQNGIVSVVGDSTKFYGDTYWVSWVPTVSSGRLSWACTYSSNAESHISDNIGTCSSGTANYLTDATCTS